MPKFTATATAQRYIIPTVIGVLASAIWWGVTQNWITAVSAFGGILVIAIILWRVTPLLLEMQQIKASEIVGIYENQAAAQSRIQMLALSAVNIDILTIRGLGIIGLNDSILRRQLFDPNGLRRRIRVLLLSPTGVQAQYRAQEVGESLEAFAHGINLAIQRMKELAELKTHDLEVYLYDRQPCWRIISLNDTHFVSVFARRIEGHRATMYEIDGTKQSTLHEALRRMFDEMCATGERII